MLHLSDSSKKDLGFSPDELNNVNLREYHRVPGKLNKNIIQSISSFSLHYS